MFENISKFLDKYIPVKFVITDAIEIIILAVAFYEIMVWIRKTKAWILLKGIVAIIVFMLIASIFNLDTILWLIKNVLSVGVLAIVIIFQPELRKALEQIGKKNILSNILSLEAAKKVNERFSDKTINEFIKATAELGRTKTGALIVIEKEDSLSEYIRTGIDVDAIISSQLLINIFEHNTPLHDGAVIVQGNRIVSATCYLPLSENMELSKDLGTRHRAAVGISEVCDALTIVVSEETGKVSIAIAGELFRDVDQDYLKSKLTFLQKKTIDVNRYRLWKKGAKRDEKSKNPKA